MKKAISVLLCFAVMLGCFSLAACQRYQSPEKEVEKDPVTFITFGEFLADVEDPSVFTPYSFDRDAYVCVIHRKEDDKLPAEHDGKPVIGIVGEPGDHLSYESLSFPEGVCFISEFHGLCEGKPSLPSTLELIHKSELYSGDDMIEFPEGLKEINDSYRSFGYKHWDEKRESMQTVTFPKSLRIIKNSFGQCTALKDIVIPKTVADAAGSFCECKIQSAAIEGKDTVLTDAFCQSTVTKLSFKNGIDLIDNGFRNTTASEMTFSGKVGKITESFTECSFESVVFGGETDSVSESFNDCVIEKELVFEGSVKSIENSFNDSFNDNIVFRDSVDSVAGCFLENNRERTVRFEHGMPNSYSYADCFKDSDSYIDSFATIIDEESDAKEKADDEMLRKLDEPAKELLENALQRFMDSGAVMLDEDGRIQFDVNTNAGASRIDRIRFYSDSERERLTKKPDFKIDKAIVYAGGATKIVSTDDSAYAESIDECKYLLFYKSYISAVDKEYFIREPDGVLVDRHSITTVVYVADAETGEIVHLHEVSTDVPAKNATGKTDEAGARGYIADLLE